jgi:hypothetical protein
MQSELCSYTRLKGGGTNYIHCANVVSIHWSGNFGETSAMFHWHFELRVSDGIFLDHMQHEAH